MEGDCFLRDAQLGGNPCIIQSIRQGLKDLSFTRCELLPFLSLLLTPLTGAPDLLAAEKDLSAYGAANGSDQLFAARVLIHIARDTRIEHLRQVYIPIVGGQDQCDGIGEV